MKIAVIADTHNRLPDSVAEAISDAGEIWHLGDVCTDDILIELQAIGRPLYVVRGNCDHNFTWPLTRSLERGGLRFFLTHIPPAGLPDGCDVVLHGHTHVPRDEVVDGIRFLNPGCITRPNRGAPASFAFLTVNDNRLRWELVPLGGDRGITNPSI